MPCPDDLYQPDEALRETARESKQEVIVRRIAEPILSSLGLILVDVQLRGRGGSSFLRLVIERQTAEGRADESPTVQDCERAHILIGHALDVEDPIPHAYVMEVSSPGLDRPIRSVTDYERFQGRLARFKLAKPVRGQAVMIGRIQKLEGRQVWIETPTMSQKRRSPQATQIALALDDIQEARLEVEF
jgi:ribosome maturation factor RimP